MTIDKAVETIIYMLPVVKVYFTDDVVEAAELGVEALKAWDEQRKDTTYHHMHLLPGETKA